MKHCIHLLAAAGMVTAVTPAPAQYNDEEAYYAAEQACSEQAVEATDRDYYEAYQACMSQRGFGDEQQDEEYGDSEAYDTEL